MDNVQLLPDNEVKEVEGRLYINPQVGIDETNTFIDKFRDTQRGNTQEISDQTRMLGTDVPSSLGGLTGAGNYFTSRYQTPQTNAVTQNLRAAAQATAFKEAAENEVALWKKRYNDAYKAYQKRQYRKANSGGGGGGGGNPPDNTTEGGTETVDNTFFIDGVTSGAPGGYTVANIDTENGTVLGYTGVPYGQDGKVNYKSSAGGDYTRADAPVVQHLSGGNTGQKIWSYKLPSGALVPRSGGTLMKDVNGNYYQLKNGNYTYVGR